MYSRAVESDAKDARGMGRDRAVPSPDRSRLICAWIVLSRHVPTIWEPGTGYPRNTRSLLTRPHMMIPDSNAISNVSTNLGHPDRTACYLLSVFQKYIYQCFLALGIRDLRLPITTCAISTALLLDTCTFLKAKQSYTVSFQYNTLSHT